MRLFILPSLQLAFKLKDSFTGSQHANNVKDWTKVKPQKLFLGKCPHLETKMNLILDGDYGLAAKTNQVIRKEVLTFEGRLGRCLT